MKKIVVELEKGPMDGFTIFKDEILYFSNQLVVPSDEEISVSILKETH